VAAGRCATVDRNLAAVDRWCSTKNGDQPMAESPDVDADLVAVWTDVSERLRQARATRQMTVRTLAARIGVSPSLISQIETAKVRPSVNTLYALAVELGLSVDELLFGAQLTGPAEPPGTGTQTVCVQRAGTRASVELAPGVMWERLTGASEAGVDFLQLVYAPGSASVPEGTLHRHKGREWGYVVSGTLRVEVAGEVTDLHPGDSIAFASTTAHRLSNPGTEPAQAIWFVLGRDDEATPDGAGLHQQPAAVDVEVRPGHGAVLEQEDGGVHDIGHRDQPTERRA